MGLEMTCCYQERIIMAPGFSEERIDTKLRCPNPNHRTYMALQKPRVVCEPCEKMFADAEKNRRAKQKP
jgi:hypothetical protein